MAKPIPIPDDDDELLGQCRVETFRSGGAGVRATAQDERSQHRNKKLALERLRERLEERNRKRARPPRRKKRRESRRQKRKRVEGKRRRGRVKRLRKPPRRDD